ncbi:TetR/AcrR family transcriptional regulator C-terminal domain-containing protein [Kutzneria sp. NPDC051319]|uniref:TetR/AcrR family transcriptional regulator n=1 Tax=Kutzneria sp. NPDC051319 TaxID=3155047 RepID=UPI00343C0DC7
MPRPHTPILSPARIRATALSLVDRDGLEALSMRKLAAELGVQAASLYSHVATKDDLLHDIANDIIGRVDVGGFHDGWRAGLVRWARSYRAVLAEHPNMVPFVARGPARRDASLRMADAVHGGLVGAGWPPREATMIGAAVKYIVIGAATSSFAAGFSDDAQVYVERYPHLSQAHLLREHAEEVDEDSFELVLEALLVRLEGKRGG